MDCCEIIQQVAKALNKFNADAAAATAANDLQAYAGAGNELATWLKGFTSLWNCTFTDTLT